MTNCFSPPSFCSVMPVIQTEDAPMNFGASSIPYMKSRMKKLFTEDISGHSGNIGFAAEKYEITLFSPPLPMIAQETSSMNHAGDSR